MSDFHPPPQAQIFVCMYVVLLPYLDDIVVLFMGLYGQKMGSLYVPYGLKLLPVLHDTCFRCSIASTMFISVEFYTPKGMDYAPIMLALEEKFLMYWLDENLTHDENLILDGAINGEGEEL